MGGNRPLLPPAGLRWSPGLRGRGPGSGARAVDLDVLFLGQAEQIQPGSGAALVTSLHQLGFSVWAFTVNDPFGWGFLQFLGIDGIFIDDIPLGVALQAPF